MKVLDKGIILDGTKIQIENWKEDYSFMEYGSTLASYPTSKQTLKGSFSPNLGRKFRCEFTFNSYEETKEAFEQLLSGNKTLMDYKEFIKDRELLSCI